MRAGMPSVTVAEINLRFLADFVNVGQVGKPATPIWSSGRPIARPLRSGEHPGTDLSGLPRLPPC